MGSQLMSLVGLITIIAIAWILSTDRKKVNWKTVLSGMILQILFALIILKTSAGRNVFEGAKNMFTGLLSYTHEGSKFIFGSLVDPSSIGFIFATMVLPTIIFMSALMSVLYYLGVMQYVVKIFAWFMMKVMKTSGAESLAAAANVFAGQTEAPLVIKPYIDNMTQSELLALMIGGMATVAGGVLAAYVGLGIDAGHLLSASVMAAPAALVLAKLLMPETQESQTAGNVKMVEEKNATNIIEAAALGASEGLSLALNVGAMLLAFIALIAMLNGIIGFIGANLGFESLSLEVITGYLFSPVAFMIGVPWDDCTAVGSLLGKKLILNEFVAYMDLKELIKAESISPRAITLSTYALCGFANFSSIAIQLGGIGTLAPKRRGDLARLGLKALLGGTMAGLMTASVAGMLL